MTNNTRLQDLLDAIAPETNYTGVFDMLLCATVPRPLSDYRANETVPIIFVPGLDDDEVATLMEKTMPLGRYGARIRNIIRTYYPDARLPR